MTAQHTPGPWRLTPRWADKVDVIHSDCNTPGAASRTLARVTVRDSWVDEQSANARLIAAAPELLAALIELRKQINDFCIQYGEADFYTGDATAVIAKATGA